MTLYIQVCGLGSHAQQFQFILQRQVSLLVVGNSLWHHLGSIWIHLDTGKEFLDLCLHVVNINVAHYDDSLVVRAIPPMVVGTQGLGLEAVDDRHQTDGQTHTILGTGIYLRQGTLQHALRRTLAQSPLVVHHVAFLVYLVCFQQQAVRPVLQYQQARVECCGTLGRYVTDTINGLVDRGIGIQVTTELHAQRTGELDDAIALEVL